MTWWFFAGFVGADVAWRLMHRLEIDLLIERWIAHRLGWCTVACRGRTKPSCGPDTSRPLGYEAIVRDPLARRWWRWTTAQ